VVEGARLESVYTCKGIKGSNPLVSAEIRYLSKVKTGIGKHPFSKFTLLYFTNI
jgi:hypothetical protein